MNKVSIQTAYSKTLQKNRFPAVGAEVILKCIKPLLVGSSISAVFNSKFDSDLSKFEDNKPLAKKYRDDYIWEGAFVFKIKNDYLFIDFCEYYCYELGLNSKNISEIIKIKNISAKDIIKATQPNSYMDISFLYEDIIGCKIKDIYTICTDEDSYLLAVVIVLDNNYSLAIGKDIDNPRIDLIPSKFADKTVKTWQKDG